MIWNQVDRALPYPAPVNLDALDRTAPLTLPAPGGQPEQTRRNVHRNGTVSYKNRVLNVGRAMSGQTVTLLEHPLRLDLVETTVSSSAPWTGSSPRAPRAAAPASTSPTRPPRPAAPNHPNHARPRSHDTELPQK